MYKFLFYFCCCSFLFNCSTTTNDPIADELMSLNNSIDKKDYLEEIYRAHQGTTKNLPDDIEKINLKKVGTYLELFGHPKIAEVGPLATQTPWTIIHSQKGDDRIEVRTKYFPFFFKAFLNGDVNDGQMVMFLNRFYEFKFGEKFKGNSKFDSRDQINTLIHLLNLETSMN